MRNFIFGILALSLTATTSYAQTQRIFTCSLKAEGVTKTRSLDITNLTGLQTLSFNQGGYNLQSSANDNGVSIVVIRNIHALTAVQARAFGGHNGLSVDDIANGVAVAQGWCAIESN